MKLVNRIISIGEKYHLDLGLYFIISIWIILNYFLFQYYNYIGITLIIFGYLIWILGLITLKDAFQIRADAKILIENGIYSKIKHPIYLGGFIIDLGLIIFTYHTFLFWYLIGYTIIGNLIQLFRIKNEEKILLDKFGKKYIMYKKNTWF
ncbi:MAG: isoprenylcysteine carboxylmethyltransferase family protein [Nanoarchaeota archaeon]|nr:isoprenylcysteine carboxylmethyltransferase family protein [Nanoarchaeota archaeon]